MTAERQQLPSRAETGARLVTPNHRPTRREREKERETERGTETERDREREREQGGMEWETDRRKEGSSCEEAAQLIKH